MNETIKLAGGILTAAIIIQSARLIWPWIVTLDQGPAAFIGSMAGGAIGLFAILGGALYNAKLNRDRDDRLLNEEKRSLCTALHAELMHIGVIALHHKNLLAVDGTKSLDAARIGMVGSVITPVFNAMAPKIGLLTRPDLAHKIFTPYDNLTRLRRGADLWAAGVSSNSMDAPMPSQFVEVLNNLSDSSVEAIRILEGILADIPR